MRPFPNGAASLSIAQRGARRDLRALFKTASDQIAGVLIRSQGSSGVIPPRMEVAVRRSIEPIILALFVGGDGRSAFGEDGVTPLSPYARLLNKWYVYVTVKQARLHGAWLRRNLPEDVYGWLASRPISTVVRETENPFLRRDDESVADHIQRLQDLRIFRPNPLAEYERLHTWVDPNGYRLSDRVWNTADATRRQIDLLVADGIRQGMSAVDLARLVERFLNPEAAAIRTRTPYGADGSYAALRLARTEISRAANQAAFISAYLNPYVGGFDWALSPSHPKMDICDQYATIGMSGQRLKPAYPLASSPVPPAHPHCVTPGQLVTTLRGAVPIEAVTTSDYVLTHEGRYCRVLAAWSRHYDGLVYAVETRWGRFELTTEHPVLTVGGWVNAERLSIGQQVRYVSSTPFAGEGAHVGTIDTIHARLYSGQVYNLSVEDDNSYTVNGTAVHNCLCRGQAVVTDTPETVTARLRAIMQDAQVELYETLTPAQGEAFIAQLLGVYLSYLIAQVT